MSEQPQPPPKKSMMQEFMDFMKTFGIIGLAIAFVIGSAASRLVTALVNDIITPFIGLFMPAGDLKAMSFKVMNSEFLYGDLIANVIDFHNCIHCFHRVQTILKIRHSRIQNKTQMINRNRKRGIKPRILRMIISRLQLYHLQRIVSNTSAALYC